MLGRGASFTPKYRLPCGEHQQKIAPGILNLHNLAPQAGKRARHIPPPECPA